VEQFGILSLSMLYALLTTLSLYFISLIASNVIKNPHLPYLLPIITYPAIEIIGQRPQAFSVLGSTILLYLITKKEKTKSLALKIFLLFLLWTNLHGGVMIGLGILSLWWAISLFNKSSKKDLLTLSTVLGLAFITTLINPYTYKIFVFTWGMITNSTSFAFNSDWIPLFSPLHGSSSLLLRLIIIVSSAVAILDNPKPKNLRTLSLIFFILSIKSIRFLVPLMVTVFPLLLQTLSKATSKC
jgi:hypothetical protein